METVLELLPQLGLGLLGMLVVAYVKFFASDSEVGFSFKIFWSENKKAIIATLIGLPLILTTLALVPQAADILKTMLGLDLDFSSVENGGAFTLGMLLYSGSRSASKKA